MHPDLEDGYGGKAVALLNMDDPGEAVKYLTRRLRYQSPIRRLE